MTAIFLQALPVLTELRRAIPTRIIDPTNH